MLSRSRDHMPDSATPKVREFATRLLECEAALGIPTGVSGPVIFRVYEKLRQSLVELMGMAGVRALVSRALVMGSKEVHWLGSLRVKADGTLQGLSELAADLAQNEMAPGEVALMAELLRLLVAFIGTALTLRLIRASWPNVAIDDLNFE